MDQLPEFRVTLERVREGETAYPRGADVRSYKYLGQRTQLGGAPDYMQQAQDARPACSTCGKDMTFVAQIDSVEHQSPNNPHGVDALSDERKWMFGDVGMIYVFFCFTCLEPAAYFECG